MEIFWVEQKASASRLLNEEKKDLKPLGDLQEYLRDLEQQRGDLESWDVDTNLQDNLIAKTRQEIRVLSKNLR